MYLEERIEKLEKDNERTARAVAELTVAFTEFREETRREFREVRADISVLKADVAQLKDDVAELKTGFKRLEQNQELILNILREKLN